MRFLDSLQYFLEMRLKITLLHFFSEAASIFYKDIFPVSLSWFT